MPWINLELNFQELKQFDSRIVPSKLRYKSAPSTDQKVAISLNNTVELNNEFDRIRTVSLSELYDEERQSCEIFRPTFQLNYIYQICIQTNLELFFYLFDQMDLVD